MPTAKITLSVAVNERVVEELASGVSEAIAEIVGKPEKYVWVGVSTMNCFMGGSAEPTALVEIGSIGGLSHEVNQDLSGRLTDLVQEKVEVQRDRVYLTFTEFERTHFGWNRSTFA